MRLQVTVLRNGLAPIRNVFNTSSRQYVSEKIVLISDLLHAINQTIQLEDDDNWGFEDYIVETRLNDHQSEAYELFHYQALEDVLKEDDEVTIRPLSSTEIKQRERGGRLQINAGGMHLIDGSPWGRGFAASRSRPRISIPPRRRSVALDGLAVAGQIGGFEEDDERPTEDAPQVLQIEDTPGVSTIMPFENTDEDNEDEEEDADFTDGSESDESDESLDDETEQRSEWSTLQAGIAQEISGGTQDLQAYDSAETEHAEAPSDQHADKKRKRSDGSQRSRKTRQRVNGSAYDTVAEDVNRTSRIGSSRIVHFHDAAEKSSSEDDSDFEDSSSSSEDSQSAGDDENTGSQSRETAHLEEKDDSWSSSDDPDEEDYVDHLNSQAEHGSRILGAAPADDTTSDLDSEDSTSSSDTDSDSDSSTDSSSGSESSESADESEVSTKPAAGSITMSKPSAYIGPLVANEISSNSTEGNVELTGMNFEAESSTKQSQIMQIPVAPGHGMNKTRRNNDRKKRSKLMARLKAEGKLPDDADFQTLRVYLQENGGEDWTATGMQDTIMPDANIEADVNDKAEAEALNARKQEIFEKLNVSTAPDRTEIQPQTSLAVTDPVSTSDYPMTTMTQSLETSPATKSTPKLQAEKSYEVDENMTREPQGDEPPTKRARLDVASSRRMLFSALGVRNPKTPAAEQALREKLSKPSREVKPREAEGRLAGTAALETKSQDRWRSKLTIKAVECVNKKKTIEIPSFPFKHPWQIRREKDQGIYEEQDHEQSFYAEDMEGVAAAADETAEEQPPIASQVFTTSRTLTTGSQEPVRDDLPMPSNFDDLFDLQPSDLVVGAVIAYKELHLDDNYQPTQSPYRVAKILSKDNNDIRLQLATRYRDPADALYDEETGERIYNKFDLPEDDDQNQAEDDGIRELTFEDLILPKFVSPSETADVVVAASQASATRNTEKANSATQHTFLRGGDVSETGDQQIEVKNAIPTPRRAEINSLVKEAGFESGLDDQLLQPLNEEGQHAEGHHQESERQAQELTQVTHTEPILGTSQALLTSQDSDWISTSENLFSTPIGPIVETARDQESSLSESIVESVRYPNLSQLDVTPLPIPAQQLQSSSHQDAQRLTLTPAETNTLAVTILSDAQNNQQTSQANASSNSMRSIIPETQALTTDPVQPDIPEISVDGAPMATGPFPISSLDGSFSPKPSPLLQDESSLHDRQDSSDEVDKLPSIRSLTSSQIRKINGHRRADSSTSHDTKPKPSSYSQHGRRSPRISKAGSADLQNEDEISETESPSSSYKPIKFSASQKERAKPSLSQVPEDTIVVDLTQSSPAASPQNKAPLSRKNTRLSSGSSSAFKRVFEGLGERSVLKKKKKTSL